MSTNPPITRLPDSPGVVADLSELMDPDLCAPEGITIRRGLIRGTDGAVRDLVFAARMDRFGVEAVARSAEGGEWQHEMGMVNRADLIAALRSVTGGEGGYP